MFELGGVAFRLAPLKPEQSLKGLDLLVEKVLPLLGDAVAGEKAEGEFFSKLGRAAAILPDVYRLFLSVCDVRKGEAWLPLKDFDEVFMRRSPLMFAWISRCLREEYKDFFTENGRQLVGQAVNDWSSLFGSTGESGES